MTEQQAIAATINTARQQAKTIKGINKRKRKRKIKYIKKP